MFTLVFRNHRYVPAVGPMVDTHHPPEHAVATRLALPLVKACSFRLVFLQLKPALGLCLHACLYYAAPHCRRPASALPALPFAVFLVLPLFARLPAALTCTCTYLAPFLPRFFDLFCLFVAHTFAFFAFAQPFAPLIGLSPAGTTCTRPPRSILSHYLSLQNYLWAHFYSLHATHQVCPFIYGNL